MCVCCVYVQYVFGSFMSRDNTYKLLVTLWKHSQDSVSRADNPAPTPITYSWKSHMQCSASALIL